MFILPENASNFFTVFKRAINSPHCLRDEHVKDMTASSNGPEGERLPPLDVTSLRNERHLCKKGVNHNMDAIINLRERVLCMA